jgi:hypothetical protein
MSPPCFVYGRLILCDRLPPGSVTGDAFVSVKMQGGVPCGRPPSHEQSRCGVAAA